MTTYHYEYEDCLLRDLINSCSSNADLEDDKTPIAIDANTMQWLTAKQINDRYKNDNA